MNNINLSNTLDNVISLAVTYGGKLLLALIVLLVGRFVIKYVKKFMDKKEANTNIDRTLWAILKNVVNVVLYAVIAMCIIEIMGVPMTSIMTLVASCGLAVGLSLQGALANLAGGIMILLFKPFKVGDYIESGDCEGEVRDISIFYTSLLTLDNKRVNIPNGDLMNSNITNYTAEELRRVDYDYKITNDTDLKNAISVLSKAANKTKNVVKEPKPFVRLVALDDDTYIVTVRVWCKAEDYWDVYFDTLENCSQALADNGIDDPEERLAVRIVK